MLSDKISGPLVDYLQAPHARLNHLDLSYNNLTDVTGVKLALALYSNFHLSHLNF
jgi:Ran GTPase-activating protein (RanGAP) involved in mRNA processing and transport